MKKLMTLCLITSALCGTVLADTLWSEDFSTYTDAGITGAGNNGGYPGSVSNKWSIDVSNCTLADAEDYFMAVDTSGGRMEGRDTEGEAVWTSELIDISSFSDVSISVDTTETGQSTSSSKYVSLFYKLNGSAETAFAVNPTNSGNWGSATATQNGLSGSTIQIIARVSTPLAKDLAYFDNVTVSGTPGGGGNSAPVLAAIGNKAVVVSNELSFTVSATDVNGDDIVLSATGLPSGATFNTVTNASAVSNTFTWANPAPVGVYTSTFYAADGTTNTSETITITVSEQPVLPDSVTFDFTDDAALYGELDNEEGPITYTNNGLVATFTASDGEMNRTATGFGINGDTISGDDTDAFDNNEWIDITFAIPVALTNVNTASWGSNDTAVIYINGTSNGVITADGDTPFELIVPTEQVLRIAATNGVFGNGWSLNSITVRTDTNPPPVANSLPVLSPIGNKSLIEGSSLSFTVSASDADNDEITLSVSDLPSGAVFNTVTNAGAVSNTFSWASATAGSYTPTFIADDGTTNVSETVTITVIEQPLLMISEIADPAGTGIGGYKARFVELYNAGTNSIDLTGWTLSRQDNGDTNDWTDLALTGSIDPARTYVVAYTTNFPAAYGVEPDVVDSVANGNGFDAYALYYGDLLIDLYGEINVDGDGTAWDYENDRAERNNPILEPNTTWTASEWTLTANAETNEFNPGIHGPTPEFSPVPQDQWVELGENISLIVTCINTVKTDVITLSASVLPAGATFPPAVGTNTVSSTLSMIAPTAGVYTVTFAADGDVDTTYTTIEILVVDLAADTDGDGVTNGDELVAGTDIYNAYSFFHITNTQIDTNGYYTLNWYAVSGHDYTVLWTTSLTNSFLELTTVSAPTNSWTDTDSDRAADTEGFYKLKVGPTP